MDGMTGALVYNGPDRDDAVRLSQLLCEACGQLEKLDALAGTSRDLRAWWRKHQKEDRKRLAAEAAAVALERRRAAALKKLTASDRKALGLDT